jgi:DNA-binding NarL/FixJ family response regulator
LHPYRPRVLVVDDHPGILEAVRSVLAAQFDVVGSATSGAAALDAAGALRPDVVVLDIAMPGMDGFQTAGRLKAAGSDARIAFLSNHASDDFVLAAVSRGAAAFIAKSRMGTDLPDALNHVHNGRAFVPSAGVLPLWQRLPGHRHDLQLYVGDHFMVGAVTEFFDHALEAGHSIIAIASEGHQAAIDAGLAHRRRDLAALVESGRYSRLDSSLALEAICRNGRPERALFDAALKPLIAQGLAASTASRRHVSVFGEIAPILCARGAFDEMLQLERIAGDFEAVNPVSVLCAYSHAGLCRDDALTAAVCAAHSTIVPAEPDL